MNVSEGRDEQVMSLLAGAAGEGLLDVHTDPFHHRSVLTLVGEEAPRAVARAAVEALDLTAQALERGDEALAEDAVTRLRDLRDSLVELGRLRKASSRVARHSIIWRSRMAPVVRENENVGHLDLLGASCLVLTRAAIEVDASGRAALAPSVRRIADALGEMAADPGDRATRQSAVEHAVDVARALVRIDATIGTPMAAALQAVALVITDVMVFAGVDVDDAIAAVRDGTGEFRVPAPPSTPGGDKSSTDSGSGDSTAKPAASETPSSGRTPTTATSRRGCSR